MRKISARPETGDDLRFLWLLPLAFVLHDAEELATGQSWLLRHMTEVRNAIGAAPADLVARVYASSGATVLAMGVIFVIFAASSFWAAQSRLSRASALAYASCVGAFFLHGFGHVAQTAYFGSYTPGVVTAVLVVIPAALLIYARLRRAGGIAARSLPMALLGGMAIIVPGILGALWIGRTMLA